VLKQRLENDIDRVLKPLFAALEAERSVVVGNGPTAHVETVEDIPTRIAAARELLDRAYGRSKSSSEITLISDDVLAQAMRQMEEEFAELDRDHSVTGHDQALSGN
jgi:siroheme synthase (precorrin-2 oxidase/ferrochelatase)